jgi:tight adherence protein B
MVVHMLRRFFGVYTFIGGALIVFVVFGAWIVRTRLSALVGSHPAALPASAVAGVALLLALSGILSMESAALRGTWVRRTARTTGLERLIPPPLWLRFTRRLPDPLEWLAGPILRSRMGAVMAEEWEDAGMGGKASRYLLLIVLAMAGGWLLGTRMGGLVLGVALACLGPGLPRTLVHGRAEAHRRLFGEQLPQALDAVAAGLAAGLSFQQAVDYALGELPEPVVTVFARLSRRMLLGRPVEEALGSLLDEQPDESLALVVDGVALQRKFGGDLIRMLDETAGLLRQRIELEREVHAVTTQGRFSGMIIAALLPVSAGILLAFNPQYIDVLFNTLIGQILLVFALLLQLVGWVIISRMVRVEI